VKHAHRWMPVAALGLLFLGPSSAVAAARLVGELPRAGGRPLTDLPGVDTEYGEIRSSDGSRLRSIVTIPAGSHGRRPAIAFAHWLSCDSVDFSATASDGWSLMMRRLVTESGWIVQRIDKSGVGDSTGTPCADLDYRTELAQHRAALRALMARPDVDPAHVVVFGASMGSTYAPLLAADQPVAGVVVWGGGATTWFERMLLFERHALELGGADPSGLSEQVSARAAFLERYLIGGESPAAIARTDAALGKVWSQLVGTSGELHYGRPIAFHQQAQQQNWPAAWTRVRAPVLVLYGEYDWFESRDAAALIADLVNRARPGTAEFEVIPATNHHFERYPTREAAYHEKGGTVNAGPAVERILGWLHRLVP